MRAGLAIQARGWMARAACRGMDPELFHPDRGESTAAAKAVCASCPVRDDCLEYALDAGEKLGIWGGASAKARRRIKRARHQTAADRGTAA